MFGSGSPYQLARQAVTRSHTANGAAYATSAPSSRRGTWRAQAQAAPTAYSTAWSMRSSVAPIEALPASSAPIASLRR